MAKATSKLRARPAIARSISDQLARILFDRGLTPYAVGKLAGVDHCQVSRFLNGQRDLRLSTLDRIAEALGLDLVERRRGRPARKEPPGEAVPGLAEEIDPGELSA